VEAGLVNNARRILDGLDARLHAAVELTLYGRAALSLGFPSPREEFAWSLDVDAVLWTGQAEELLAQGNFWPAVESLNQDLAPSGLYISHFFVEDQVILRSDWRQHRVAIPGSWRWLRLHRLGDVDLLLSKLMRDDPQDQSDALFIAERAGLSKEAIRAAAAQARVPDLVEIREQFSICLQKLLSAMP
jgi:hypothetical protein